MTARQTGHWCRRRLRGLNELHDGRTAERASEGRAGIQCGAVATGMARSAGRHDLPVVAAGVYESGWGDRGDFEGRPEMVQQQITAPVTVEELSTYVLDGE